MGFIIGIIVLVIVIAIAWKLLAYILKSSGYILAFLLSVGVVFVVSVFLQHLLYKMTDIVISLWIIIPAILLSIGYYFYRQEQKRYQIIDEFFTHNQMGDLSDIQNALQRANLKVEDTQDILEIVHKLVKEGKIVEELPSQLWKSNYQGPFTTELQSLTIDLDELEV